MAKLRSRNSSAPCAVVLKMSVHRGLTYEDMPGRWQDERRLTFAAFRRDQWPPLTWGVPQHVEGDDLRAIIEERRAMNRRKRMGGNRLSAPVGANEKAK